VGLSAAPRPLEDDGHRRGALGAPALEPLEAVHDLVAAARERDGAEGKVGQVVAPESAPAAEGREPRLEPVERDVKDRGAAAVDLRGGAHGQGRFHQRPRPRGPPGGTESTCRQPSAACVEKGS